MSVKVGLCLTVAALRSYPPFRDAARGFQNHFSVVGGDRNTIVTDESPLIPAGHGPQMRLRTSHVCSNDLETCVFATSLAFWGNRLCPAPAWLKCNLRTRAALL
ncbi:hypothetical protein N656DRAFT_155291 [Canariomyces notabilis]|uniref:Uncharacterized protein n=1 Tax=Canariomyces notabilis TaxID=2074819 RepID=A0AAN6TBL0_9PEZI|nr:hypothetical protein N656DRAFT_155291 [Canariomyces arenarius]